MTIKTQYYRNLNSIFWKAKCHIWAAKMWNGLIGIHIKLIRFMVVSVFKVWPKLSVDFGEKMIHNHNLLRKNVYRHSDKVEECIDMYRKIKNSHVK